MPYVKLKALRDLRFSEVEFPGDWRPPEVDCPDHHTVYSGVD